jgi:hypothetical protein
LTSSASIDSLPFSIPIDFIVGAAGLGTVLGFLSGLAINSLPALRWSRTIDPLRTAGYGGGTAAGLALALLLISSDAEVIS